MSDKAKKILILSIVSILVLLIIIFTAITISKLNEKEKVETVVATYTEEKVQEKLEEKETAEIEELTVQDDGKNTIGVVQIPKIDFEGLIYEGTSLDVLAKGVGHFDNSPYIDGNVCIAAHNTNKFWAKLNTLQADDTIKYISFLGTKEYKVQSVEEIQETDWTRLENTEENCLTLITCVKGKPELRLCVRAIEIK